MQGCQQDTPAPDTGDKRAASHDDWDKMLRAEKLIRKLSGRLSAMSRSVLNLQLPDVEGRRLLAQSIVFRDIASQEPTSRHQLDQLEITQRKWPLAEQEERATSANLCLWDPLLSQVDYFQYAKFKLVKGKFSTAEAFDTDVKFSGLAQLKSGKLSWVRSKLLVRWQLEPTVGDVEEWRIAQWQTKSFTVLDADSLLFHEVLDQVISDPEKLQQARRSLHEELVTRWLMNPKTAEVPKHFDAPAFDRHPGIAVVDIDQDGLDDIYVMARWGKNILLRNRGDGTFGEQAADVGLDLDGYTSAAIFADFDNDGDRDAFLGRTLQPSAYLENVDGHFVDRSHDLDDRTLPYLTSSLSVVDYNQDGLLDIYVSTYAIRMIAAYFERPNHASPQMILSDFIAHDDARRLFQMVIGTRALIPMRWPGPPNILLRNEGGGRFVTADDAPNLRTFTNTYQATWSDFDGDGDQDVYLANDYAPNNLFRNDGGTFVDVTRETGTADIGFGMGASWGDYDHDGHYDLYVSNMYSTAGRRIAGRLDVHPEIPKMARGNTLFRNEVGQFKHVSSVEPPGLLVENSGWAWGGQFVDVDNDTYLDLVSLAGYYTSPVGYRDRPDI